MAVRKNFKEVDKRASLKKTSTNERIMEREELNYYLQHAPLQQLQTLCSTIEEEEVVTRIQKPTSQTLLIPVNDPITQGSFFSGEALVTSAIVQVNQVNGWAMVMDDSPDLALAVALLDGAYAAGVRTEEIVTLGHSGKEAIDAKNSALNKKVKATCVAFDLL